MKANESYLYCENCKIFSSTYFYTSFLTFWIENKKNIKKKIDYLQNEVFWVNSVISTNENWSEKTCLQFILYEHFEHTTVIKDTDY